MANDETMWREVLQRLTKIEANTQNLGDVAKKAQEAHSIACANKDDIKELKDAQKTTRGWMMTIASGIIVYIITNYILMK